MVSGEIFGIMLVTIIAAVIASAYFYYAYNTASLSLNNANSRLSNATSQMKLYRQQLAAMNLSNLSYTQDYGFNLNASIYVYTSSFSYLKNGLYYNCTQQKIVNGTFALNVSSGSMSNGTMHNITLNVPHNGYLVINFSASQNGRATGSQTPIGPEEAYNYSLGQDVYYPVCARKIYYEQYPYYNESTSETYSSYSVNMSINEENVTNILISNSTYSGAYEAIGTITAGMPELVPVLRGKVLLIIKNSNPVPVAVHLRIKYVT